MKIICFIRGIFRSITNLRIISGHNYKEIYDNKDLQILECETCGDISIGWKVGSDNKKRKTGGGYLWHFV